MHEKVSTCEVMNDPADVHDHSFQTSDGIRGDTRSKSTSLERWCLKQLLRTFGDPPIVVELWDRQIVQSPQTKELPGEDKYLLRIKNRRSLLKILFAPEFEFAESYTLGDLEVDGSLTDLMMSLFESWWERSSNSLSESLLTRLTRRSRSVRAAKDNVHRHYDLGNDFYRLWLDDQMLYTCAYFESPDVTLEEAQVAKMDYICRKLCLRPGDRVIEAGCGWGALALHMARQYGAQVIAYNVSSEQLEHARKQACSAGLEHLVAFIEDDWRNIRGTCDVFVSVGMLEHVGPENFRELGQAVRGCLTDQGRGLIHSIGLNSNRQLDRWTATKIFPGAQPPTLQQAMSIFEPFDMNVIDVENLHAHYALTLRHWLEKFEKSADTARAMFDDKFIRMWRFYLASSVAAFETEWLQLYQILFTPANSKAFPMTREHLYQSRVDFRASQEPVSYTK